MGNSKTNIAGLTAPFSKDGSVVLCSQELKALRKRVGLSQEGVAKSCSQKRLPLSIASLKRAEKGNSISYRTARTLALFYEVRIQDILSKYSHAEDFVGGSTSRAKDKNCATQCVQNDISQRLPVNFSSKILIVDDHAVFREGLLYILQAFDDKYEVLEASSLMGAISVVTEQTDLDLMLLDLKLPDATGLSGFYKIQEKFPLLPIALLSATEEKKIMVEAIQHGAQGYIHKSISSSVLKNVLKLIISGGVYVPDMAVA